MFSVYQLFPSCLLPSSPSHYRSLLPLSISIHTVNLHHTAHPRHLHHTIDLYSRYRSLFTLSISITQSIPSIIDNPTMSLPFNPPQTPVKRHSLPPQIPLPCIADGSFYRVFQSSPNTVLRVSKRGNEDYLKEVEILERVRECPFINRMDKWWIEEGVIYFEMERCECNLREYIKFIDRDNSVTDNNNNVIDRDNSVNDYNNVMDSNNQKDYNNHCTDSFISDPFSDSLVHCSTSFILDESSSSDNHCNNHCDDDSHHTNSNINSNSNSPILTIPSWIKTLMLHTSTALAHIHSLGIIHMDIKPENILVSTDTVTFKLCDFNISQIGEGKFFLDGDKIYMAPEILKNKCYFVSDVFSMGLVYLELLNNKRLPKEGEEYRRLRRNDFRGWKVDFIGRRMLERDPRLRCKSVEVMEYFNTTVG